MAHNPHLEEFFANSRRVKAEIEADTDLMERVRTLSKKFLDPSGIFWEGYKLLQQGRFGLKNRTNYQGMTESVITADVYAPDFPSSPFLVVVHKDELGENMSYIVQDFSPLSEARKSLHHGDDQTALEPKIAALQERLRVRGYELFSTQRLIPFGLVENGSERSVVVHDLDQKPFIRFSNILRGVMSGEWPYAHLKEIYERINSELTLKL